MSPQHPQKEQLIAFGQGKLAAEESSKVEQHLEVCRECCETMLDLKDDTFIGLVKIAQPSSSDESPLGLPQRPAGFCATSDSNKDESSAKAVEPPGQARGRDVVGHSTDGGIANRSAHAATVLVQSGEPIGHDELPPELAEHPRYRIVELIGRGGMGNVYRAEHRLMNRPVAIKLINSQLMQNPQAVERFRREVQAAAKLSHSNIVAAYDAEQAGNAHFLVMEFVEGTDLASVVKHRGLMLVAEACECIRQAAVGLQHAHEKGMVHRDIKPHNLMLAAGGQVRILDFGLAGFASEAALTGTTECNPQREQGTAGQDDLTTESPGATALADASGYMATAAHLTAMGVVMGTPDYMAPEQAVDAHSADIRADIYSLGCTLYFLLTGRPPFEQEGVIGKLKAHASVSPPSLADERNDVPLELSDIVARMMAKKPESRFQTPAEVAAALEPFASRETRIKARSCIGWRLAIATALLVPLLLLGVIISIATDKGVIEIDAQANDDPLAQIVLKRDGQETMRMKLKPGKETQSIATGEYRVELVTADHDSELNVFTQHRRPTEYFLGIPLKTYLHNAQEDPQSPIMVYRGSGLVVRVIKKNKMSRPTMPTDEDRLQGHWVAKTIKTGNGAMPAGAVPQWTMTFNGQSVQVTSPTGRNEGTFKLDVSKEPKEIDIEPTAGQGLIRGIYRFVGNELEVCIEDSNRKRPIQWDVDAGTRQMLIRLQRDAAKTNLGQRTSSPNRFVRDQQAGEWILRIGGTLRVSMEGVERHVTKREELPDGDWQITEISVYPAHFDGTAKLDKLAGLQSLRWLRLFNTQISDDGFQHLTDVPKLTLIDLDYNHATTDASLAHMAKQLPSLTDLGLHGAAITDAGLEHLGQLKNLKALNLTATKVTGTGLPHLAELGALHYLILNSTSITDESLKPLAEFPALENLELLKTSITDESVEHLVQLKKLKRLVILETKISSTGLAKLKIALPDCQIEAFTAEQQKEQWRRVAESPAWTPFEPTQLTANGGTTLRRLDDASLLAEGPNPAQSIYTITAKTSLKQITALRLDVIRDDKLPGKGPGRHDNGTFVLTGIEVRTSPAPGAPERSLRLSRAITDYSQYGHDVSRFPDGSGSWAIWRDTEPMQNQSLIVDLAESLAIREGTTISVTLRHESVWSGASLGHFRLSATEDKRAPVEKTTQPAATSNRSPLESLRDQLAVAAYLNNPGNNTGGSVPVALLGREGRVAFRFGNWLVVFEGIVCDPQATILGFSNFNVPLKGSSGEGTIDFGAGDKLPGVLIKYKFANELNEISINNHRFKLRGKATRLEFDDKTFDATNSLQTILVARDGTTKLEPPKNENPEATGGVGQNLLTDPSFENTGLTQLPQGWRAWLNDGPEFRCEVVAGGHTGQRCLKISGKGTRGVVFANDIKADRSKRYALKGWAKFEGDTNARAIIKFNYFKDGEFLGVHDLVGATADQGWQFFEKTDSLDRYPTANHFYAMCHVEGSGTGWFDDLELVAYDRDKLPDDFDVRHGRNNRLTGANSLDRWVGLWETQYVFRETDNAPTETKLTMKTPAERTLGGYFVMSHDSVDAANTRKPTPAEPTTTAAIGGNERLLFLTFDQNLGAFRQWMLGSNGKAFEWRGPWNDATKTLELRMLPDASNLYSAERFVDAEHIEGTIWQQFVMGRRDAGRWTATRTAAAAKVDIPVVKTHAAEPAELSQLNKFAGEWTILAKYKQSVWNPQPREETASETSVWILGGRFLMTKSFNAEGQLTAIWLATYDPTEKTNRFWFFNADGSSSQSRLTWDEASRGFHFRAIDMPNGWTGTGFNRWVDADEFDNTALIKDENGRVLLDMSQERRRKK
jgi:uncharacterized protein (TIGR03067 family)